MTRWAESLWVTVCINVCGGLYVYVGGSRGYSKDEPSMPEHGALAGPACRQTALRRLGGLRRRELTDRCCAPTVSGIRRSATLPHTPLYLTHTPTYLP